MKPQEVDLRPGVDNVEDQGRIGSCTAMGTHKIVEIALERLGRRVNLSPMYQFFYAQEKGRPFVGDGAKLIHAIEVLMERGTCTEKLWPHIEANYKVKPPPECDVEAEQYKLVTGWEWYNSPTTMVEEITTWLAQGKPVTANMEVMQSLVNEGNLQHNWREFSWENVSNFNNASLGDHNVVIIGYSYPAQRILVQNSWGPQWADGGFFGVPFSMVPKVFNDVRSLKLSIPYVNAGWVEEPIDQFNRMMDWAESQFSFPRDTTKDFGQYWYRKYWETYVGLDRDRDQFVKMENGVITDLGSRTYWLEKMDGA
jgi:hypothetical protein